MNKSFRVTNKIEELAKVISTIKNDFAEFTIWQNINNEKKVIPGVLRGFMHRTDKFFIDFEISENGGILEQEKVYMFCQEHNILVKGTIKLLSKNSLQIKVDKKFYLNEQRDLFRMNVEEKTIDLFVKRKIEQLEKEKDETVRLKDLSNSGCGFFINPSRATQFQKGNTISIEKVGKIDLEEPIKGQIAHVTPVKMDKGVNEKAFLVGVKFDDVFPNIDHLLQMVEFGMTKIT